MRTSDCHRGHEEHPDDKPVWRRYLIEPPRRRNQRLTGRIAKAPTRVLAPARRRPITRGWRGRVVPTLAVVHVGLAAQQQATAQRLNVEGVAMLVVQRIVRA